MPSPKVSLDLGSWSEQAFPQERNNDIEYNLLLRKFKTFYNEVKDFQRLHNNCSVTRASQSEQAIDASSFASNSFKNIKGLTNSSNDSSHSTIQSNGGQNVLSLKEKFSQNQDFSSKDYKEQLTKHNITQHFQSRPLQNFPNRRQNFAGGPITQGLHYNSSHNLVSLATTNSLNSNNNSSLGLSKPEARQRNQPAMSYRIISSKSSERLNNFNNNNGLQMISSNSEKQESGLAMPLSGKTTGFARRDSKYIPNDDSIYDAVSPDDSQEFETSTGATSLSSLQKPRLDPPKSPTTFETDRPDFNTAAISPTCVPTTNSSKKSSPNDANDQERSNNSFSSSVMLDVSNNTSSSLSLVPNYTDQEYGNYVNIDFFLKRSQSPSFDGLEEDSSEVSEEETTQMSHSLSSDQLCQTELKDLSPRELAIKLSNQSHNNASDSVTPASSAECIDDSLQLTHQLSSSSSASKHQDGNNSKFSSFFSTAGHDSDNSSVLLRNSSRQGESPRSLYPAQHQRNLASIHESLTMPSKQDASYVKSDSSAFAEAQNTIRSFLSDLNLSPVHDIFEDKAQRRIVKESFAVEFCGRRKLRHLFLFNDVIVCAKYQASSKQKFTFDVKWFLNLNGVTVSDQDESSHTKYDEETMENQILATRTNLMLLRCKMQQLKRGKDKKLPKIIKKLQRKRTELEAELVLLLPHLPLVIRHFNGKKYTFFLSSNFDRNQWIESIKFLQSQLPASKSPSATPSSSELQAWIQTCRKNLNPSLGTFLLRSNCDDDLLYGDLLVNLSSIKNIPKPGHYYFCFEVDSYGHFSQKASSIVMNFDSPNNDLSEEYVFPLDGAHTLRILLHEDLGPNLKPSVIGKAQIELSRTWYPDKPVEKIIEFSSNCNMIVKLSYSNSELLTMQIPHTKLCPAFGLDITQVCKKEKTNVPLLIQLCVNEVERRGMKEVGIYRMSGTSTDIQRLKRAFETNPYVAELLMRDIDINSVTGFLKQYLREMPEGLFINKLYLKFVAAFNIPQTDSVERTKKMLELFHKIPVTNQHTIIYLVEHLLKVYKFESYNKMSLTNLATVIGPNILRPPTSSTNNDSSDPFTAVVIGSMSQAGILYFFLNRKACNLPLTDLDSSDLAKVQQSG